MNRERLFNLYCNGVITLEEMEERLKADRRESLIRYLDLYLEGRISKDDLIAVLDEEE